jgi:hypothetical protein
VQRIALLGLLDALGHQLQPEAVGKLDDAAHQA